MIDPCKACAEITCMGICADQVQYKQVSGDGGSDKAADNKS